MHCTPKHMFSCHKSEPINQVVQKIDRGSVHTFLLRQNNGSWAVQPADRTMTHIWLPCDRRRCWPLERLKGPSASCHPSCSVRLAASQEDDRPHGQDRSQQAWQERQNRCSWAGISFLSELCFCGGPRSMWGLGGQRCLIETLSVLDICRLVKMSHNSYLSKNMKNMNSTWVTVLL